MAVATTQPLDVSAALQAHRGKQASIEVQKDGVICDLGNLAAYDPTPSDLKALKDKAQAHDYILNTTRDNIQLLFNAIWQQPAQAMEDAVLAQLPPPAFRLPREKPVPEQKAETKWEAFAKLKGIKKTKRSRMVWDEEKGDWAPRYGYKRANDDTKAWLIPVPENADPYEDQFEKAEKAKKDRVAKNEKNRMRNVARASGKKSTTPAPAPAPAPATKEAAKKDIEKQILATKKSTASIGRFDAAIANEPKIKTPGVGKKRKFEPNVAPRSDRGSEKAKLAKLADQVINSGGKVVNTKKAANRELQNVQHKAKQSAKSAKQGKKRRSTRK